MVWEVKAHEHCTLALDVDSAGRRAATASLEEDGGVVKLWDVKARS